MMSSLLVVARTAPVSEDGVQLSGMKRPCILTIRSKSLEVLIPILYLNGISTGDFDALLGKDAGGLSPDARTLGSTSTCAGRSVTLLRSAMSTFGLTGSTFRLG